MQELLRQVSSCLERGKVDRGSPYPPDLAGRPGVDELTAQALEAGISPESVLSGALIPAMERIGASFKENRIFLPDVLMAARAMHAGMKHLEPYFHSGDVRHKGLVVLGTVSGDLHDIGKKIVGMFLEGGGWRVVDLGVDVGAEGYIAAIEEHKPAAVGLSALLTTTMANMESIVSRVRGACPEVKQMVGGAPVSQAFADGIGADLYSPNPLGALDFLNSNCALG